MTLTVAVLRELRPIARKVGPLFCSGCGREARRIWDCNGVDGPREAVCLDCMRDEAGEWSFILVARRDEAVERRRAEPPAAGRQRRTG